jgi:monoamine oxidase
MNHWLRVEGGVAAIANQIAEALKYNPFANLLLNQSVQRIDVEPQYVKVSTHNTTIRSKHIIVTVPPITVNNIHFYKNGTFLHELAGAMDMNQHIPMTAGFKAMFVYDKPFWREKGLSGHIVAPNEPINVVWDASPMKGNQGCLILLTLPVNQQFNLAGMSLQQRKELLTHSLMKFLGEDARHVVAYVDHFWDSDAYTMGSVGVPSLGSWTEYGPHLRKPVQRIHWASSERALESWAQMDGAVESGERIGNEVIKAFVTFKKSSIKNQSYRKIQFH